MRRPESLDRDPAHLSRQIRLHCLRMTSGGGSSHIASCLSIADILAVLYGRVLHVDPERPKHPGRDRFILSKGHAGAAVYAALAETGFFPTEELDSHYRDGSALSGHVSHKGVPGVEISTGSLGHGLGVGSGMALALQPFEDNRRVIVLMSDGECDEGSNWEAILFSGHHRLRNLVAIVDYNKIQSLGPVAETLDLEPLEAKWSSFGWEVRRCSGHDLGDLEHAFREATGDAPVVVIADTVKGKGVSFMEGRVLWHYRTAEGSELMSAIAEVEGRA